MQPALHYTPGLIHLIQKTAAFLPTGYPSCRPTNTAKALTDLRPTYPPTLRDGKRVPAKVMMFCGWGVNARWLIPYVDKRVGGR